MIFRYALAVWPAVTYLLALGLTLVIEVPIYTAALNRWLSVRLWPATGLGVVVNLITHPQVWFTLYPALEPRFGYSVYLVTAELFAWLVEALVLWVCLRRAPALLLGLSLVANGSSLLVGAALQQAGLAV